MRKHTGFVVNSLFGAIQTRTSLSKYALIRKGMLWTYIHWPFGY